MQTINDTAGLSAILDQLRASQAWQNANNQSTAVEQVQHGSEAPSVAALLSQLNPIQAVSQPVASVSATDQPATAQPAQTAQAEPSEDIRYLTFQQALPKLSQLDSAVLAAIQQLKRDQEKLERDLFAERVAIRTKYEAKVTVAQNKARLIGANGVSKHEAEMISRAYEKELKQFDTERALLAWEQLVAKQQSALAQLNVPAMFPTTERTDREASLCSSSLQT
ncbi:hypothetical protein HMN09_00505100 [Mycena chlorophos]|uniref:Uncharacterized protein n=1 Tax=Mycena chlorophos TaxID=658473 RepID=A0A8H6TAX5_MYCCL|nr:hypothetical protein HMN09_00505100 [Mycena chlorophos]